MEYLLKGRLAGTLIEDLGESVHFGCTSEDINNLAYARLVHRAVREVWLPAAGHVADQLAGVALLYRSVALLARTHGQPATSRRWERSWRSRHGGCGASLRGSRRASTWGKLNGSTDKYAAWAAAASEVDWQSVSQEFIEGLGLTWNPLTLRIEWHDWQAELYADVERFKELTRGRRVDETAMHDFVRSLGLPALVGRRLLDQRRRATPGWRTNWWTTDATGVKYEQLPVHSGRW